MPRYLGNTKTTFLICKILSFEVVDEVIYKRPPTFLVGTVDKFANVTRHEQMRYLFGLDDQGKRKYSPPNLIIQDELHLISGPLGTMVGIFEVLFDMVAYELYSFDEKNGVEYYFLTEEEFDQEIARNHFLEWAHFAGARYGTPREPVEHELSAGKNVLLEIDIEGAKQVKVHAPEAILVFLEPPSWEELVSRLERRATDSPQRRAERLQLAQEELAAASFFDHRLINDQVENIVQKLLSLASAH
jgi:guanylate kinase